MASLRFQDKAEVVKRVAETVSYLSRLIFPRPLPTFRIRRDSRRLQTLRARSYV